MTAEGYKSQPLSDEMEHRIRERLKLERIEPRTNWQMERHHMESICDGRISALEWVLNEAEALKLTGLRLERSPQSRFDECNRCGHVHQGQVCGMKMGGAPECKCELQGVPR